MPKPKPLTAKQRKILSDFIVTLKKGRDFGSALETAMCNHICSQAKLNKGFDIKRFEEQHQSLIQSLYRDRHQGDSPDA